MVRKLEHRRADGPTARVSCLSPGRPNSADITGIYGSQQKEKVRCVGEKRLGKAVGKSGLVGKSILAKAFEEKHLGMREIAQGKKV